ncbi:MAG: hypothetical protein AVDCRST_MAG15-458, partial [uncultured Rubellimicrobium sp.]
DPCAAARLAKRERRRHPCGGRPHPPDRGAGREKSPVGACRLWEGAAGGRALGRSRTPDLARAPVGGRADRGGHGRLCDGAAHGGSDRTGDAALPVHL